MSTMSLYHHARAALRRRVLLVATVAIAQAPAGKPFLDVGKQPPITILVASTPWYPAFEKVVGLYEQQTGNSIKLDTTPFGGMLEKARNAVRSGKSPYDLMMLDTQWTIEFYEGGFLVAAQGDRRDLRSAQGSAELRRLRLLERAEALAHRRRRQAHGLYACWATCSSSTIAPTCSSRPGSRRRRPGRTCSRRAPSSTTRRRRTASSCAARRATASATTGRA